MKYGMDREETLQLQLDAANANTDFILAQSQAKTNEIASLNLQLMDLKQECQSHVTELAKLKQLHQTKSYEIGY